ncbi:uncharacterized [Tachysurus ichikawai]
MLAQLGEQHLQMEKKRVRDCGLVALWFECKTAAALRHDQFTPLSHSVSQSHDITGVNHTVIWTRKQLA